MVQITTSILAATLALSYVSAVPLQKRISQTISDSTTQWVAACTKAGGGSQCGTVSQNAFQTLLAAGGNCDQQNAADQMVDLAKQLNNNAAMINLSQIFVQQPRNAPDSLQVPYCQTAPKNQELNGYFHCQFASSNFQKFSGDQTGNLPLGVTAVNPPGSCPAMNSPVPDSVQLDTLVQSPGAPIGGSANTTAASTSANSAVSAVGIASSTATLAGSTVATVSTSATAAGSAASITARSSASPLDAATALNNGKEAQSQNAGFAIKNATSPCTTGEQGCVNGDFAQCVGGKFETTPCAGGTRCFSLPLVNKAGTSITCSTAVDAASRIAATGAQGGITGS